MILRDMGGAVASKAGDAQFFHGENLHGRSLLEEVRDTLRARHLVPQSCIPRTEPGNPAET